MRAIEPVTIMQPPGFFAEFLGTLTRCEFIGAEATDAARLVTVTTPPFEEEYFEWIDLLEAVAEARGEFVMFELGAGYGRWSVRGAAAARARGITQIRCAAVEAEPTHFRWLRQHFRDNDLNPADHELIWAAIDSEGGFVPFRVGQPAELYGQRIVPEATTPYPDAHERRRLLARSALGRPPAGRADVPSSAWVPAVTLNELLAPYSYVDLIDMDLQRRELEVVHSSIHLLDARVRRIHIGTHSNRIEGQLRDLFTRHKWQPVHDFARRSTVRTPYGDITFQDGVQSWLNPRLVTRSAQREPNASTHARASQRLETLNNTLKARNVRLSAARRTLRERVRAAEAGMKQLRRENRELTAHTAALTERCRQLDRELLVMSQSVRSRTTAAFRRLRSLLHIGR